jgi:phosphoglycerate dehydrogenase-like enzyme
LSNRYVYITEPNAIDIGRTEHRLEAAGYQHVCGNLQFSNASTEYETLVIRSATYIDSTIKAYFPSLKNIIRIGSGLDNINLEYCKKNDIAVFNAPGANASAVAEYVIGVTLYVIRKLHLLEQSDVKTWNRFKFRGGSIRNKAIGIVGFGNVGKALYERFKGLGCSTFFVYDPYLSPGTKEFYEEISFVSFNELISQADVVSLHIPLIDETRHVVDKKVLPYFKRDSILINASRGGIVDEIALLAQLRNSPEMIYIADTVENEPCVRDGLVRQHNVVVTPHIASLTNEAEVSMLDEALGNFIHGNFVKL